MPPIDRLLSQYSNPVRSWPGEEDLDAEARANYEAANPPKLQTEGGSIDKGDLLPIVRYPEAKTSPSQWQSSSDVMRQLDDGWRIEPFSRLTAPFKSMAEAWRTQPVLGPMVRPSQMHPEAFNQMSSDAMTVAGTGMTGGIGRAAVGHALPAGTAELGIFGGRKAKTADLDALARAEEMARVGTPREEIWSQTGWFSGPDGKWRFEIDDSGATFRGKDRLRHPDMYDAYDDLRDSVVLRSGRQNEGAYMPGFGPMPDRIVIGPDSADPRSIALHEYQHAIQKREGFAKGESPSGLLKEASRIPNTPEARALWGDDKVDQAKALMAPGGPDLAMDLYKRHAGETEARAVQARQDLTPEQRRARAPWLDYDVPEKDQIVRFGNGEGAMASQAQPLRVDEFGKPILWEKDGYSIAVNDVESPTYLSAWHEGKKVGNLYLTKTKQGGEKWLSVDAIDVDPAHRGNRLGEQLFREAIRIAPDDFAGVYNYAPNQVNQTEIPRIFAKLGAETKDGDHVFLRRSSPTLMASIDPLTAAGGGREAAVEALRGAAKADPAAKIIDAIPASEIDALVKEGVIKRKQIEGLSVGQVLSRMEGKKPLLKAPRLEARPMNKAALHEIAGATYLTPYIIDPVKEVPLSKLHGQHFTPEKVAPLKEKIRQNKWIEPLVVDREGHVIEGQHRLRALKELGVDKVPVHMIREVLPDTASAAIRDAARSAGIHDQQARQIAQQISEIISADAVGELRLYEPPRGFEGAWAAAVKAAEELNADGTLDAYAKSSFADQKAAGGRVAY